MLFWNYNLWGGCLFRRGHLLEHGCLLEKVPVPLVPLVNDQQEPSPYEIYPQSRKMEEINDTIFSCLSQHSSLTTKKQLKIEEYLTIKSTIFANEKIYCFLNWNSMTYTSHSWRRGGGEVGPGMQDASSDQKTSLLL